MATLRQTLIADRIDALATSLDLTSDQAFERLAHTLCTEIGIYDFDDSDLVDGTQDKQIDLISIIEEEKEATIHLISVKKDNGFSSNAIILTKNGLDWVFRRSKTELETLGNVAFREKILTVRSALQQIGYANVNIRVSFVTTGITANISNEFKQEQIGITKDFDNQTFKSFTFEALGADELIEIIKRQDKKERAIDAEIAIKYDANAGSLIRYTSKGRRGLICTANASEIARLVEEDKSGSLFESNVRRFLGQSGAVNSDISTTASSPDESSLFWFLNNGITILCDSMDASIDPDEPKLKIKNLQIVNGCQTASSLAHAAREGHLQPDTNVLLKIFETNDENLASKIVLTTNNQNKISSRDLKANDPIQIDIRSALEPYGLLYEHKLNQYLGVKISPDKRVVSNEKLAQAYLAIALKKPSDASRRKYKIWSEYYQQIFKVTNLARHVLAYYASDISYQWAKTHRKSISDAGIERRLLASGSLHIARTALELWENSEITLNVEVMINHLTLTPSIFNDYLTSSLRLLVSIIEDNPVFLEDLDLALKSQTFDEAINVKLKPKSRQQIPLAF